MVSRVRLCKGLSCHVWQWVSSTPTLICCASQVWLDRGQRICTNNQEMLSANYQWRHIAALICYSRNAMVMYAVIMIFDVCGIIMRLSKMPIQLLHHIIHVWWSFHHCFAVNLKKGCLNLMPSDRQSENVCPLQQARILYHRWLVF